MLCMWDREQVTSIDTTLTIKGVHFNFNPFLEDPHFTLCFVPNNRKTNDSNT